jgi:two-component system, NarL family, nitrate/nitrite response regulator NarL
MPGSPQHRSYPRRGALAPGGPTVASARPQPPRGFTAVAGFAANSAGTCPPAVTAHTRLRDRNRTPTAVGSRLLPSPGPAPESMTFRVLIVDDTLLYLEALADFLCRRPEISQAATAADLGLALRHVATSSQDAVLVSTAMTDGRAVVRAISEAAAQVPIIALAMREIEEEVVAWAEAGVAGFLFREEPLEDLVPVIQSAVRGETLCPPRITATLLRSVTRLAAQRQPDPDVSRLTAREQEIVGLIDEGLSNKEIARRLTIEVRTVKNHVHNILQKLKVRRRGDAAARMRARSPC